MKRFIGGAGVVPYASSLSSAGTSALGGSARAPETGGLQPAGQLTTYDLLAICPPNLRGTHEAEPRSTG
eukprot:13125512-Heterocapsa_arctica.AAC.1